MKQSKGNEVEIVNDYYWDIATEELYSAYQEPKNISLGQLSDDKNELDRLIKSDNGIAYDLKRLSEILKALSLGNQTAF